MHEFPPYRSIWGMDISTEPPDGSREVITTSNGTINVPTWMAGDNTIDYTYAPKDPAPVLKSPEPRYWGVDTPVLNFTGVNEKVFEEVLEALPTVKEVSITKHNRSSGLDVVVQAEFMQGKKITAAITAMEWLDGTPVDVIVKAITKEATRIQPSLLKKEIPVRVVKMQD